MTLVKRGKIFHYDFWFKGRRHQGTTDQTEKDQAARVEAKVRERLRLDRWDLAIVDRLDTPSFTAWAEQYLAHQRKRVRRPDIINRTLRMVLAFWGKRPTKSPPVDGGVYHDLRLLDPIADPDWIVRFEAWMTDRGVAGSTKNSYRSAMSGLYELALRPQWRKHARIKENPFRHIDRDRRVKRKTELSVACLHAWLSKADPHARLALAIGALAPKLRLQQVLDLRFDRHLDRELTTIRYSEHKTVGHTEDDQVTAIAPELRAILLAVRKTRRRPTHVILYRDKPVKSIKRALKSAAKDAGLVYGMEPGGVTFHTLRHAMATEIARLGGVSRVLHAALLGHSDARTTEQFYTHLALEDERAVLERLATKIDLSALLVDDAGKLVGTQYRRRGKDRAKRGTRKPRNERQESG